MPEPRASTDEERAPLLDHDEEQGSGFFHALTHPSRPLTNLERLLTLVGVALLILSATFVGLFVSTKSTLSREKQHHGAGRGGHGGHVTVTATTTVAAVPTGKPEVDVCLTPECVQLSASILSSLNTSTDPCENFYEFANGGWLASHTIPADQSSNGAFQITAEVNRNIIRKIIDAIPQADQQTHALEKASTQEQNLRKLRDTYDSCMNIDHLNKLGLKPIEPYVEYIVDHFGQFDLIPAPEDASSSAETADWAETYTEDYRLPRDLFDAATRSAELRLARQRGGVTWTDVQATQIAQETTTTPTHEQTDEEEDRARRLTETISWLHVRGVGVLFGFSIEGDSTGNNSQIQGLNLYQAFGGLPSKQYYEEKAILDLYQQVVKDMLVAIVTHDGSSKQGRKRDEVATLVELTDQSIESSGWPWPWPGHDDDNKGDPEPFPDPPKESVEQRMDRLATKVVHFERELIRAGADLEHLFNPRYSSNVYSFDEVDKALPFVDLKAYLTSAPISAIPEKITVTHPPYLKSVSRLVEQAPDYVLSAYFVTHLALEYAAYLGPETALWQAQRRLKEVLQGLKRGTEEDRQSTCLKLVDTVVGEIAGGEFVKHAFSSNAKEDGTRIINNIIDTFYKKLPHISWMDEKSATAAQKKAKSILVKVGYSLSPDVTDPESLAKWYKHVNINVNEYFGNVLSSVQAESDRQWTGLGKERDRQTWIMNPQTVNAYYNPPDGEIVFPAGILQPTAAYAYSWPSYLKYGGLGSVAAHELTHAFDNSGAQYDEHGLLRDWWTNTTVKAFEARAQCIARQYSKYYVVGPDGKKEHVNGNLTNGENIGDSGIAQAFQAWKDADSASLSKPLRLPGLEHFSDEQLFFVGFARVWAMLIRPAAAVDRVRTDPHSPNVWRVIGTLRNSEAFHNAFQCKEGSGMRPPKADQCKLW